MKNKKIFFTFLLGCILVLFFAFQLSRTNSSFQTHYNYSLIFEKQFSEDDFFKFSNTSESNKFHIYPAPFRQSYNIPSIIGIDSQENYYLLYLTKLKVFDKTGRKIMNFDFSEKWNLFYSSLDESDNLYLYIDTDEPYTKERIAYKINATKSENKILENRDIEKLPLELRPPLTEIDKLVRYKNSISENGTYYNLGWGGVLSGLHTNENLRYINPETIHVFRFDNTFNIPYDGIIYEEKINLISDQYKYENINLSELMNEKVIYVGSWKVTKKGDVYLSGIKSNNINRVKTSTEGFYSIDVLNPTFFLVKLENK